MLSTVDVDGGDGEVAGELDVVRATLDAGHGFARRASIDEIFCIWVTGHSTTAIENEVEDAPPWPAWSVEEGSSHGG